RDCVRLIEPLAHERGLRLETDLSAARCHGDSERLAQVITNLLTNAIHYNRDKGEIKLATHAENSSAVLTVSDTGRGIPSADVPHVFERFFRSDPSRTEGRSGLGLAISKAIVAAHGGTIELSSEIGQGTTCTVRLPQN